MSKALTNSEKQKRFEASQAKKGLIRIREWVPADRKSMFKAIAKEMREGGK